MRVLLVEDDVLLSLPLEDCLLEAGHEVEVVYNGNDALKALRRDPRGHDVLVTDIRLGTGPDGWEVASRARELNENIRVVYMTGESAASWGPNGVTNSTLFQKPYHLEALVQSLSWPPAASIDL